MSFGFSVGDFIAVAELATNLYQALDDAKGSKQEYKDIMELLRTLSDNLTAVHSFVIQLSDVAELPPSDVKLLSGLKENLNACKKTIQDFRYITMSLPMVRYSTDSA
jgi:hypothetical protein